MKVGDLVMCTWQPRCSKVINNRALPMEHIIKGEIGIITNVHNDKAAAEIMFLHLGGYVHSLATNTFEVINEIR